MCGTVRIASYSRSERNGNCRVGAPVGHAFDPFSLLSSRLAFRLHFHPPSRLDYRRKTNRERTTFHPTLTASRFPLFFLFVFLFSLSFRQRRSILSRSSTALVRPRTFSNTFLFILADILVTFFLQFSWMFGTTTTRLPTHPRHRSVYHRIRLPSVGTHVFKQPPRRGRH